MNIGKSSAEEKKPDPHPLVLDLIENLEVFRKYPVDPSPSLTRTNLPVPMPAAEVSKIWTFLKDNIGRELSRITMPVSFNEPLSILQRCSENLEYQQIFRIANNCDDPGMRLAYIMAGFILSQTTATRRFKKPFNPLLGETYEYVQDDLYFIAEQVSHHPPVTCFYGECDDFIFDSHFQVKTNLTLTSFTINNPSVSKITLKNYKETYTINHPNVSLHNYIVGSPYSWIIGDIECVCLESKYRGEIHLPTKGWTSTGDYKLKGKVFDGAGKQLLKLKGQWNKQIEAINAANEKDVTVLGKIFPDPQNSKDIYNFSYFDIQLNYLNTRMVSLLPPTDSRLRPDQRAYEFGDLALSSSEKNRLEENQRARRRQMEKEGIMWTPMWFDFRFEDDHVISSFNGQYWKARSTGSWPGHIPKIFN